MKKVFLEHVLSGKLFGVVYAGQFMQWFEEEKNRETKKRVIKER